MRTTFLLISAAALITSCNEHHSNVDDASTSQDAGDAALTDVPIIVDDGVQMDGEGLPDAPVISDAATDTMIATDFGFPITPTRVDLLFVVDNSGSMEQEQASLAEELPRLVRVLATGDRDGDGTADFTAVESLHIGVITTDMGVGGFPGIPTCNSGTAGGAMFGDDGILQIDGHTATPGCMATYDPYLEFRPGDHPSDLGAAAEAAGASAGCVAHAGTAGCGFEQQLEAMLKALTPSTDTERQFFGPTLGHGDRENAGFLRPDSIIGVVVVSDENDGSIDVEDVDVFNQASTVYTGDLNLRTFNFPSVLTSIARYADGLRALRPGRPDMVVFSAVVGIPTDLATSTEFTAALADARMVESVRTDGPAAGRQLSPACMDGTRGEAFPGRRFVELAAALAPYSTVQSICQDDLSGVLDAAISTLGVP